MSAGRDDLRSPRFPRDPAAGRLDAGAVGGRPPGLPDRPGWVPPR